MVFTRQETKDIEDIFISRWHEGLGRSTDKAEGEKKHTNKRLANAHIAEKLKHLDIDCELGVPHFIATRKQ
ncbi:hypothetical protein PBY51_000243 [Eleginops maclovinus]|nr:hypothetical protein PBY51_000243 [Eleginops maclovinus]